MKDVYKMTVRFDLTDARERALAEFMQTLDVKRYHSRNNFIIEALADYVDLQSITREQHEEDILKHLPIMWICSRSPVNSTRKIFETSFVRKCGLALQKQTSLRSL